MFFKVKNETALPSPVTAFPTLPEGGWLGCIGSRQNQRQSFERSDRETTLTH